jgi:hypothetical protein
MIAAMVDACPACNDAASWCDACGGTSSSGAMISTAGCRGAFWAEDVAGALTVPAPSWPPWPSWETSPRVRAIALRKIADLGGDARTRELRARYCCESAARRYEELRGEVAAGARAV